MPVSHGAWNDFLSFSSSDNVAIFGNGKQAMQDLNRRLALYLEKVISLETANLKLEQKIKDFYESRAPTSRKDLTTYFSIIEDLQKQIFATAKGKQEVFMKLDNSNLAASDFKMKTEGEKNMRLTVEADLHRLRVVSQDLEMETKNLEFQLSGLKEDLIFLKKNHEEDMHMVRTQKEGSVDVHVDCAPAVNLNKELEDMRQQYEELILKNRTKIEQWFESKAKNLNIKSHNEITSSKNTSSELKKKYQTLEIETKAMRSQIEILQKDLVQVNARYGERLSHLQLYIDQLQTELQQIKVNIKEQDMEYQMLLDIKMRLEMEIAEYRRLLEGDGYTIQESNTSKISTASKTVTTKVTEEKHEKKEVHVEPHVHQRRVKVITEELYDGKVVRTSVDEKLEDLS